MSDFIGDFLTRIRNASKAHHEKVTVSTSKLTAKVAEILKEEGFIDNVKLFSEEKKQFLRVHLKYIRGKRPAIQGIKRISTPGRRIYVDHEEIPRIQGGLGLAIVSTSRGILTDRQARDAKVGGELLCTVW